MGAALAAGMLGAAAWGPAPAHAAPAHAAPAMDPFWSEPTDPEAIAELRALKLDSCPLMADGFESEPHLPDWQPKFVRPPERFDLQDEFRVEGDRALAISLLKSDLLWSKNKHKHELREANRKRCRFGQEVWYSFAFRIEGDYPRFGSTRWVVGQWKEENRASPFLAQRFDNGVFHITVQSNDHREVIAAAPGDYTMEYPFFTQAFRDDLAARVPRDASDFARRVSGFRSADGLGAIDVPAYAKALTEQDLDQFPFLADRPDYSPIPGLKLTFSATPVLPNPTDGWVRMRYRVRGGRDGTGLVEVWANDRFVVRAEGKIGNDVFEGPTQYFKIGHYRDVEDTFGWATVYVDDFKRGVRREDVD